MDPAVPPGLADYIAELERRIRNLERSPQFGSSSIDSGGTLTVQGNVDILDSTGKLVVRIGKVDAVNNRYGVELYDVTTGRGVARFGQINSSSFGLAINSGSVDGYNKNWIYFDSAVGQHRPSERIPFHTPSATVSITSATFTACFEVQTGPVSAPDVSFGGRVFVPSGTTVELQVVNLYTAAVLGTRTIVGTGADVNYTWSYDLTTLGTLEPTHAGFWFALQARRTAGTGTIFIYEPNDGLVMGRGAVTVTNSIT